MAGPQGYNPELRTLQWRAVCGCRDDGRELASSGAWYFLMEPTHPQSSRPSKPILSLDGSLNLLLAASLPRLLF